MAEPKAPKKPVAKKKVVAAKAKPLAVKASDTAGIIKAANKAPGSAVANGDAVAIGKMYTKTAKLLPANAELLKGTKAITAFWQGVLDAGVKGATLKSQEVEKLGTTAIEVGTYTLSGEGGSTLDKGKYIAVWKKEGREWKLHRDMINSNSAPAA